MMADVARDAFANSNYRLAAEMYENCLKERGGASLELYLGYGNSLARCGRLKEALDVFSYCCCQGSAAGWALDKLRHLVAALMEAVGTREEHGEILPTGFTCPCCEGVLLHPVTASCGHTLCRSCLAREGCRRCGTEMLAGLETNVLMKGLAEKWWPEEHTAARLRDHGNQHFQRNDIEAALAKYDEAIYHAPNNHLILSNRSHALYRLNRLQAALSDADTVVRLRPTWSKGHYRRGMALTGLGRYEEAFISYSLCVALDGNTGAVRQELSRVLLRLLVSGSRSRSPHAAPYSLLRNRHHHPRLFAAPHCSSDCEDNSSSGEEDIAQQISQKLPLPSPTSSPITVPENPRLHMLLDRMFQEIDKIRKVERKPVDLSVDPDLVDPADFDCVLCCRTLWQPVTTPCGHTYCWMCLDRCLDYSFACPLCMTSLADYLATSQKVVTEVIEHCLKLLLPSEYVARQVTHHQELSDLVQLWGRQVPMFVCTTGFPKVPCPLYVYEPRYRVMMRHCAEAGTREFGIVACLTKDQGQKSYADYGTMLEIRDWILLDNGCSILTTVGVNRFRVLTRGERDGYDTAKVEFFRDQAVPSECLPELKNLHERVHCRCLQWFSSLESELQAEIVRAFGDMPELEDDWPMLADGPAWAWWILAFLPLNQELKVEILATTSLEKRLRAVDKTLDRIQIARREQTERWQQQQQLQQQQQQQQQQQLQQQRQQHQLQQQLQQHQLQQLQQQQLQQQRQQQQLQQQRQQQASNANSSSSFSSPHFLGEGRAVETS